MELYTQILDNAGPAFRTILLHIRDNSTEACLFHCTGKRYSAFRRTCPHIPELAGKDRTGLFAAILLKLAGVDDEQIAIDYSLTRVGREPMREKVMARLQKEPLFAENNEAALNMFTCRKETMLAFLSLFQEKYGGAKRYFKNYCQFDNDDIELIRKNFIASIGKSQL
jgi:hypothetical protein